MNWRPKHPALRELIAALLREVSPIYLVGGMVRDLLAHGEMEPNDVDVVLEPPAIPVARRVADTLGWAFYIMDEARDVSRLLFTANAGEHLAVDISAMQGPSIEYDLQQRDFTVNAMALMVHQDGRAEVLDPVGGRRDLEQGILRVVSPLSLVDDPVRTLRAVRLQAQLGFRIEPVTRDQIARLAASVRHASPERVRDELWKMLASHNAGQAVRELRALGLLMRVLPEVESKPSFAALWETPADELARLVRAVEFAAALRDWLLNREAARGLDAGLTAMLMPYCYRLRRLYQEPVAANRTRAEWLVWAALFLDSGKERARPATSAIAEAAAAPTNGPDLAAAAAAVERLAHLRFSRAEIMLVEKALAEHTRARRLHDTYGQEPLPRRERYRYFRQTDGRAFTYRVGIDALLLSLVDVRSSTEELPAGWNDFVAHAGELLSFAFEQNGAAATATPLVDGHLLMKHLRIAPGKQVGDLLDFLMEAQAVGEITSQEEALDMAFSWLRDRNREVR